MIVVSMPSTGATQPAQARASPTFRDDIAQRTLACTGCHGAEGRAATDGYYPRIAGKPAGYLFAQLRHFRDRRRSYPLMSHLVQHLTDDYLREIADHFASLELPYAAPAPVAASADQLARGRSLALDGDPSRRLPACAACHGHALTGVSPAIPGLLGLPRDYLNAQFGAWRIGQRQADAPDCMAEISRRMSADDVAAVSGWLAAQPMPANPKPANPKPVNAGPPNRGPTSAASDAARSDPSLACGGVPGP